MPSQLRLRVGELVPFSFSTCDLATYSKIRIKVVELKKLPRTGRACLFLLPQIKMSRPSEMNKSALNRLYLSKRGSSAHGKKPERKALPRPEDTSLCFSSRQASFFREDILKEIGKKVEAIQPGMLIPRPRLPCTIIIVVLTLFSCLFFQVTLFLRMKSNASMMRSMS